MLARESINNLTGIEFSSSLAVLDMRNTRRITLLICMGCQGLILGERNSLILSIRVYDLGDALGHHDLQN